MAENSLIGNSAVDSHGRGKAWNPEPEMEPDPEPEQETELDMKI